MPSRRKWRDHVGSAGTVAALICGLWLEHLLWAENLIKDGSSFEAGLDGCALAVTSGRLHRECASVRLEIDPTTAAHGARSLKFTRPSSCRNRYGLYYKPIVLIPGKSYTLSAYLRCASDGGQMGLLLGGFSSQPGKGLMAQSHIQMFRVTQDWTRYELRVSRLPSSAPADETPGACLYYAAVVAGETGSTFWIDAVQLEEGDAGPFSTGKTLELSVSTNRAGNLFFANERIIPGAEIYAPEPVGTVTLSYRALDVLGDEVAAGRMEVDIPPDGHAAVDLPLFSLTGRGWVTIEVTASCGGLQEKDYVCAAVIEKLPAPQEQRCQFGFNFNMVSSPEDFGAGEQWHESNAHLSLDRVFRLAPHAGVRWQRAAQIFFWERRPERSCEISPGKFVFFDEAVRAIKSYGLEIMGTLGNANARDDFCPAWAESGRRSRTAPIPAMEAWRRYIRTIVEHYKDEIKTWEIINEPNTAFWARDYLPLLQAAYGEAKAADPQCRIVGICATSDFSGDPYGYVREVAEGGGLKSLDAVSGHTFCKGRPWQSRGPMMSWDYMLDLARMLREFAPDRELPLWNTEGIKYAAWTDRPNIPRTTAEFASTKMNRNMALPQRLAAAYAVRDCVIEFSSGAHVLFLWEFRNALLNANIAFAGALGLMDWFAYDGTPQAKFVALNALAEKLRSAKPVEQFGLSPRVRAALFENPSGVFCVLWRENQDESDLHSYILPVQARVQVEDMFGRPISAQEREGRVQVVVSEIPVYVLMGKDSTPRDLASTVKEAAQHVKFADDAPLQNPLLLRRGRRAVERGAAP